MTDTNSIVNDTNFEDEPQDTEVHQVTILVVDHDGLGVEELKCVLENTRFPNRCINPEVMKIKTATVPWTDEHPLNSTAEGVAWAEYNKIFPYDEGIQDEEAAIIFSSASARLALPDLTKLDGEAPVDNHMLLAGAIFDLIRNMSPEEVEQCISIHAKKVLSMVPLLGKKDVLPPPAGLEELL